MNEGHGNECAVSFLGIYKSDFLYSVPNILQFLPYQRSTGSVQYSFCNGRPYRNIVKFLLYYAMRYKNKDYSILFYSKKTNFYFYKISNYDDGFIYTIKKRSIDLKCMIEYARKNRRPLLLLQSIIINSNLPKKQFKSCIKFVLSMIHRFCVDSLVLCNTHKFCVGIITSKLVTNQ